MARCATGDCGGAATRKVSWRSPRVGSAGYCEACAERLWLAGDEVDPPFPLASVVPIR